MEYIECIVELLKCAITGEEFNSDVSKLEPNALYKIADSHKLANILYVPLKNKLDMNADGWNRFQNAYDIGVMISYQQEYYLEAISELLIENKIWFIPLKGSVLKYLYPTPDMRQSADIDILFDESRANDVKTLLENEGFTNTQFEEYHDVYINNNIMVEMHRSLLSEQSPWYKEVGLIRSRAVTDDGYHYTMTNEDFYIFDIVHTAKHASRGGIGIRAMLDIWVYLRRYNDELDWKVIHERLARLDLVDFEANVRKLLDYWFNNGEKTDTVAKLERYIVQSGWIGTYEQKLALRSKDYVKTNKLRFLLSRTFLPVYEMRKQYHYLRKYPFLLPVAWTDHVIKTLFVRKGAAKAVWQRYDKLAADDINDLKQVVKDIGL